MIKQFEFPNDDMAMEFADTLIDNFTLNTTRNKSEITVSFRVMLYVTVDDTDEKALTESVEETVALLTRREGKKS